MKIEKIAKIEKSKRKKIFCRYSLFRVTALVMVGIFVSGLFPARAKADEATPPPASTSAAPSTQASSASAAAAPMDAAPNLDLCAGSPSASTLDAAEGSGIGNTSMAGVEPSTGVAHASIPFQLPHARGQAQPHLGISYSSSSGIGDAGVGWSLAGIPSIERHNISGGPRYRDPAPGAAIDPAVEDRFTLNGQELVPVCLLKGGQCANGAALPAGEVFPTLQGNTNADDGWMYYRPAVDRGYTRAFWSPDHRTWLVQSPGGAQMELGAPLDSGATDSLDLDTDANAQSPPVFRWRLARQYGSDRLSNIIVYDWKRDPFDNLAYLTDIYFSYSNIWIGGADRKAFAHHVHLNYEYTYSPYSDKVLTGQVVWRRTPLQKLDEVQITSAPFSGDGNRQLVRDYRLTYGVAVLLQDRFRLSRVDMFGQCSVQEDASGSLPTDLLGICTPWPTQPVAIMDYWGPGNPVLPASISDYTYVGHTAPNVSSEEFVDLDGDGTADVVGLDANHNPFVRLRPADSATKSLAVSIPNVEGLDNRYGTLVGPSIMGNWLGAPAVTGLSFSVSFDPGANDLYWGGRFLVPYETLGKASWEGSPKSEDHHLFNFDLGWDGYGNPPAEYYGDLDGDGNVDRLVFVPTVSADSDQADGDRYATLFTSVDNTGKIQPFSVQSAQSFQTWSNYADGGDKATAGDLTAEGKRGYLLDINGDGILDLVRYFEIGQQSSNQGGAERWIVWLGKGNGTFREWRLSAKYTPGGDPTFVKNYLHDVNGDGIADQLVLTIPAHGTDAPLPSLKITFGQADEEFTADSPSVSFDIPENVAESAGATTLSFADVDGTGLESIIVLTNTVTNSGNLSAAWAFSLSGNRLTADNSNQDARSPGLLKSIMGPLGAVTTLEYNTVERNSAMKSERKIPQPLHMVTKVTTSSPVDVPGAGGPFVTTYDYSDPVYDASNRRFRGFHSVTANQWANGFVDRTVTTTFLLGNCSDFVAQSVQCDPSQSPMPDNPLEVLSGLPVLVSQSAGVPGPAGSTVHYAYDVRPLYTGMDGRVVRTAWAEQTQTWFDDTPVTSTQSVTMSDVLSEDPNISPPDRTFTVRQTAAGRQHIHLMSQTERDLFGNVTSTVNFGMLDSDSDYPQDAPISTIFKNWSLPPGDATGWNWRPSDVDLADRHTHFKYDPRGLVTDTYADLHGTLPLDRFHEDSTSEVAPTPADASQDGQNLLRSHVTSDTWGNPQQTTGPDGRCTEVVYDPVYHQLPISTTVYTQGCGGAGITSSVEYDRGLEVPTKSTDATGAVSRVEYDVFGRPLRMYSPDPNNLGTAQSDPSTKFTYIDALPPYTFYGRVQVDRRDDDGSAPRYRTSWTYTNPFGQVAATVRQADIYNGDKAAFVVSGEAERDIHGRIVKRYEPRFATVDPNSMTPPPRDPTAPASTIEYSVPPTDGWRRVRTYAPDATLLGSVYYSPLTETSYRGSDPDQSLPQYTIRDGFGRIRLVSKVTRQGAAIDTISTEFSHLQTGEVSQVHRFHTGGPENYYREIKYDTFGRIVENDEPNTSSNYGASNMKSWRYAYNDAGQLVGTSDARGCGKNLAYDMAGRLVSETYSPCLKSQAPYADKATTMFVYDAPEQGQGGNAALYIGRLAASYDRAQHTQYSYDARGRLAGIARQLAVPDNAEAGAALDPAATPGGEYAAHWYKSAIAYDDANRIIAQSMGADVPELQGKSVTAGGLTGTDLVTTGYTIRGIADTAGGSYGDLITGVWTAADNQDTTIAWGDAAPTWERRGFDGRRRLSIGRVDRPKPSFWSAGSAPAGYSPPRPNESGQTILEEFQISYDQNDNPTAVTDDRIAAEWPDGAKPVNRGLSYDDLDELREVDYSYATGTNDDTQVSPFDAEAKEHDPRPVPQAALSKRVRAQTYNYDWQGNLSASDDDSHAFFDRSVGTIEHGSSSSGPNRANTAQGTAGLATVAYDAAGNMVGLEVTKPGPNGSPITMRFDYEWDEVGQLVHAKRTPVSGDASDSGVDYRYTYDADGQRVLKSVIDPPTQERRYSGDVLSTLRLKMAPFSGGDFQRTADTEVVYLASAAGVLGHVVYDSAGKLPSLDGSKQHVYLVLNDWLGSTMSVIDKATSELVERVTYQGYGDVESDYRPTRWQSAREDFRFTGKEDDVGAGIMYFGARYYVPSLGQWASADPLTVHGLGSDLNPYAFVVGSPQRNTDPTGLYSCSGTCEDGAGEGGGSDWDFHDIDSEGPWQAGGAGGLLMGWSPFGSSVGDARSSFVALFGHSEYWQEWTKRLLDDQAVEALEEITPPDQWGSWEPWEWLGVAGSKWVGACDETSACGATGAYLKDRWDYWSGHPREYWEGFKDKADKAQVAAQVGATLGGAGGGPGPAFAPAGGGVTPTPTIEPIAPLAASAPALLASRGEGRKGEGGYREKTRGANRADSRQVDDAAREAGITNRRGFGKFIEQEKMAANRGGSDNFTYEELLELADEFMRSGGH